MLLIITLNAFQDSDEEVEVEDDFIPSEEEIEVSLLDCNSKILDSVFCQRVYHFRKFLYRQHPKNHIEGNRNKGMWKLNTKWINLLGLLE